MGSLEKDAIVLEDIRSILDSNRDINNLSGKTVFITGGTGLIGSFIVKLLIEAGKSLPSPIKVLVLSRNAEKILDIFGKEYSKKIRVVEGDILQLPSIDFPIDYFIHGASVTSSLQFIEQPVNTIETIVNGTQNVLDLALRLKAKSFVFLSSMEVFGFVQNTKPVDESEYGYIDILNVRSSYPESKRLAECLCSAYSKEFGLSVYIARLAQTIGPGMEYGDSRVAGHFARAVIEGKDIVLTTDGSTKRNTIYVADAASAILTILLNGEQGQAYNVADKHSFLSIKDTAIMIASKISANKIKVICGNKKDSLYSFNDSLSLNLSTVKLEKLNWKALFNLEESYRRLITSFK